VIAGYDTRRIPGVPLQRSDGDQQSRANGLEEKAREARCRGKSRCRRRTSVLRSTQILLLASTSRDVLRTRTLGEIQEQL
jgi:hypothetical protein